MIHTESNIGKLKTESAAAFVSAFNSSVKFLTINEKIEPENIQSIFQNYDLVVDGSDNFTTRYLVNDACVALSKTLVYGSIFGFEGQIAVFNYKGSKIYGIFFRSRQIRMMSPIVIKRSSGTITRNCRNHDGDAGFKDYYRSSGDHQSANNRRYAELEFYEDRILSTAIVF